jgi:hypothetical protein
MRDNRYLIRPVCPALDVCYIHSMKDSSQTSGVQGSDAASTPTQSRYVVIDLLPPERQEWLRQQSLHVAEVYRRAAATAESEANWQTPTIVTVNDPDTGDGADNGKA